MVDGSIYAMLNINLLSSSVVQYIFDHIDNHLVYANDITDIRKLHLKSDDLYFNFHFYHELLRNRYHIT